MAQTLCICLIWMYEVVWGGYQPQPWRCGIISTPQLNLNPQILGQLGCYNGIRVHPYLLETWDSIPMSQTLCICLLWMYEAVWSRYQPQPWRYGIIFTPQVTLTSQILGQLGRCNCIRVHPYSLETAYQWLEHFIYVLYRCMKWSDVDTSLNHDVMASFSHHKPRKWNKNCTGGWRIDLGDYNYGVSYT